MQWYSKSNYCSLNQNDTIYNDGKQYYKIIERYVTYHVSKISSHQPLIHKKYLDKIKRIVYMADMDSDNYSAENQRWIDKKRERLFNKVHISLSEMREANEKS